MFTLSTQGHPITSGSSYFSTPISSFYAAFEDAAELLEKLQGGSITVSRDSHNTDIIPNARRHLDTGYISGWSLRATDIDKSLFFRIEVIYTREHIASRIYTASIRLHKISEAGQIEASAEMAHNIYDSVWLDTVRQWVADIVCGWIHATQL